MTTQANPYAPPGAHVEDVAGAAGEYETIRQKHIKHEASIRSVGILYYLSGTVTGIAAAVLLASLFSAQVTLTTGLLGIVYVGLSILTFAVGRGLRVFRPWARTTAIVLGFIGLLGFPLGTLIHGYILYLLMSAKGKRIFAPDYPQIVAATPGIRYRTSIIVWIALGLLLALIAAVVLLALFTPR